MSDEMKISFVVEITGCSTEKGKRCPHLTRTIFGDSCEKADVQRVFEAVLENRYKLTESCPMVKAQFEALT